jgi:hypothetical protein
MTENPACRVRELLSLAINDAGSVADLPVEDLDLLLRVARRVRLLGRIGIGLRESGRLQELPEIAQDHFDSALRMAEARRRLASWEVKRFDWSMIDDSETPIILMKGCAYLVLELPNAPGRIFADVDLMVPEDKLAHIEKNLNERGWIGKEITPYDDNYYRRWTHEIPPLVHVEREVEIDLHHNILPRTARLKPDSGKLLENARRIEGSRFSVLSDEDMALHSMLHLFMSSELADDLRDLVDIAELLQAFSADDAGYWDRLMARAKDLGLTRLLYYGLHYSARFLDLKVPEAVLRKTSRWAPLWPASWLMDTLVPLGLFPDHPDHLSRSSRIARFLLFLRSHWIRMPPWLLVYHLGYKLFVTRILRTQNATD